MTDDTHDTDRRTAPTADRAPTDQTAEQTPTEQTTADRASTEQTTTVTDGGTDPDAVETANGETTASSTVDGSTGARLRRLVDYLALAGLALLALVAGIQVYTAIDATIGRFVVREYRPLFRGVVNLALLLLAAGGVTLQLRRLR